MKCSTHPDSEATAVCIHCGRALCSACITKSKSNRIVCSTTCASALLSAEQAIDSLRTKSASSYRSNGYFMIAIAVVFVVFTMLAYRQYPILGPFVLPCAGVFAVTGVVFIRLAKRKESRDDAS